MKKKPAFDERKFSHHLGPSGCGKPFRHAGLVDDDGCDCFDECVHCRVVRSNHAIVQSTNYGPILVCPTALFEKR